VGDPLRGRREEAGPLSEPAHRQPPPQLDVRIGSSTNALRPISSAQRSLAAGTQQWLGFGAIALAAVFADQLTKQLVANALALGEEVHIVGPFSIHHVQNSGIAFGLFSDATSIVIGLTALAVTWMLVFFARSGRRHPILPVALGFVLGGSLSNLLDRIRLGHVTDFLDVRFWPAFNLADSFIVVGVAILFAALAAADRRSHRPSLGHSPLQRL
jgi:signal peptidase II